MNSVAICGFVMARSMTLSDASPLRMCMDVGIMLFMCIKSRLFIMLKSCVPRVLLVLQPQDRWWALKSPIIKQGEVIWENNSEMR